MNAAVVIVTYNRKELLKECIECVYSQITKFKYVVVVDNACSDGSSDWLDTLQYDNIHIIHEKTNGGGAKGFSDGVKYVHKNLDAEWLLLIDDDAMLSEDYLDVIMKEAEKHSDSQAFSGTVVTGGVIDITHRKRLIKDSNFNIVPVDINCYNEDSFEYDLSSFCGLIFKIDIITLIGYPRADYFIWYDDTEYSIRIKQVTKIININKSIINHKTKLVQGSAVLDWKGYYGIRNSGDVIKRYGDKRHYIKFYIRIKIAEYKNKVLYYITRNKDFYFNSNLYHDAIADLENNNFGFNVNYHP